MSVIRTKVYRSCYLFTLLNEFRFQSFSFIHSYWGTVDEEDAHKTEHIKYHAYLVDKNFSFSIFNFMQRKNVDLKMNVDIW